MTTPINDARRKVLGDGSTLVFAIDFGFRQQSDIVVTKYSAGVATAQVLNTHYTLDQTSSSSGCNCTFVTAPAADEEILFERNEAQDQAYNLTTQQFVRTDLNESFDHLCRVVQQMGRDLDRAIKMHRFSDNFAAGMEWPEVSAADDGKFVIQSDYATKKLAMATSVTGTAVSAAMQPVVQAADLNAGRIALGVAGYYPIAPVVLASGTGIVAFTTTGISAHTPAGVARFAQLKIATYIVPNGSDDFCTVTVRNPSATTQAYSTTADNGLPTVDAREQRSVLVPLNSSEEFQHEVTASATFVSLAWSITLEGYWL